MKFTDIPQLLTNKANYKVDVGFKYFSKTINQYIEEYGLILNPEFQRGHVWTENQQIAWLEYHLRGGKSGNTIYLNNPFWHSNRQSKDGEYKDYVCVDGLQRITAAQRFINNEIKVFGSYFSKYEDRINITDAAMYLNVNDLKTEKEVLQWYVDMNSGGTPHTSNEIEKVKKMIQELG